MVMFTFSSEFHNTKHKLYKTIILPFTLLVKNWSIKCLVEYLKLRTVEVIWEWRKLCNEGICQKLFNRLCIYYELETKEHVWNVGSETSWKDKETQCIDTTYDAGCVNVNW